MQDKMSYDDDVATHEASLDDIASLTDRRSIAMLATHLIGRVGIALIECMNSDLLRTRAYRLVFQLAKSSKLTISMLPSFD